ncbi:MAG: MAPEG family protein, partial [Arenicella sp.]|nr:MAPEG family protein [Arenicella sp.]
VMQGRVSRAGINFQESLPAFLALGILALVQQVELSQAASLWLLLRIVYIPCYLFNLIYVRTVVWLGSLICLIYMAIRLL